LLNSSVVNLVNIFIPILFGYATLGFYMLAQRVLGLPSTILGKSIGKVFYEEAVSQKKKFASTQAIFLSTLKRLFLIGFVIFTLLFMTIEDIIYFVFGKDWITSAIVIKILIPLFFIRFISSSLSSLLMVYEKQRVELIVNMVLFFTTTILLFINQNDFIKFLTLYSLFMSINYLILLSYMYRLSKGDI
jgi:O-antigen/teichoic acid export membrane protein